MAQIIAIPTRIKAVHDSVVEIAQEILVRARRGEFESIAVAVVYKDLHSGAFASQTERSATLIGACYELLHELTDYKHVTNSRNPEYPDPLNESEETGMWRELRRWIRRNCYRDRYHTRKPKRRVATVDLTFGQVGEDIMSTAVIHVGDKGVTATLVPKDASGAPAIPASVPEWTLSADGIVAMTVAADGLSASFVGVTSGTVTADALVEGDPVAGVDTIHATGEIQVLAAEIATVDMNFAPNV